MSGPVTINWGDGSAPQDGPEKGDVKHTYTDGDYTAVVADKDDPSKKTEVEIHIPMGGGETPTVTAAADPADTTGRTVKVTYSGFPTGTIKVSWGDGTPEETGKPASGELTHPYAAGVEGAQTITLTSEADATKTASASFTPTQGGGGTPTVTAEADPADTTGRTVKVTFADFPAAGAVTVKWGDNTADTTVPAGQTTASHPYAAGVEGEQTITATSATDATKTATTTFTPGGGTPAEPSLTAEADPADTTGRTVKVTLDGFPAASAVTVSWGDGTADTSVQAGTTEASHQYAETVTGEQVITATSAGDATKTASAMFTPGSGTPTTPSVTAEADPADTTGRTAKVTLAGYPEGSAVNVSWGDGTTDTSVPAGTTEASHAYEAGVQGEQTITATSAGDATKTATATFTPGGAGEGPTVTAEADSADTTGRTVKITLAGFPADGAVTVDYGDGTAAVEVPAGTTQASHPYAAGVEGEQTITATSVTDQTKTATTSFTPGSAGEAPTVTATADPADTTGRTVKVTLVGFPADNAVTVDYGDGTAAASVPAGTTEASHAYAAAVTGEQTITATSAGDATKTATTTFTPGGGQAPPPVRGSRKRR